MIAEDWITRETLKVDTRTTSDISEMRAPATGANLHNERELDSRGDEHKQTIRCFEEK
jgi:hypothetical protein